MKEKLGIMFSFDPRLHLTPYVVEREVVKVTHVDVAHFATEEDAKAYIKMKEAEANG